LYIFAVVLVERSLLPDRDSDRDYDKELQRSRYFLAAKSARKLVA